MDRSGVSSLPHTPFIDALDARSRRVLAAASVTLDVKHGEVVVAAGEPVDHLYVVEHGILHAEVSDQDGEPLAVARFGPGDFFGEMSFLRSDVAAATVRASTDAELLAIPHSTLARIAERHPAVMRELAVVVARRLNATNAQLRRVKVGRAVGCLLGPTTLTRTVFSAICYSAVEHLCGPVLVVDLSGSLEIRAAHRFAGLHSALQDRAHLEEHDQLVEHRPMTVGLVSNTGGAAIDETALANLVSDYTDRYELVLVAALSTSREAIDLLGCTDERTHFHDATSSTDTIAETAGEFDMVLVSDHEVNRRDRVVEPGPIHTIVAEAALDGGELPVAAAKSIGWVARHLLRRKVGLALGAGGSKGYAHVGVVQGLEAAGIPIDFIAGSSVGAPIAWAVARGMPTDGIHDALHKTFRRALRPTIPLNSLLTTRWIRQDLERFVNHGGFEDLAIPLAIVAVDPLRRTEVVFTSGDLVTAMLASTAIPGLFPPVRWRGHHLVDGGLLNPIPSSVVHDLGADIVIGVKLTNPIETDLRPQTRHRLVPPAPPIIDTIQSAIETLQWKIVQDGGAHADVTLEPKFHGPTGLHDYTRGDHFVAAGHDAVEAAAPELKALFPWAKL